MDDRKTLSLFSAFILISSLACFAWLLVFPQYPQIVYVVLSGMAVIHILTGSEFPAFLSVAVAACIPVIARISALTIAPILGISQEIVILFVLFCLGFSYAFPVIKWHFTLPGLRHSLTAVLFISLSIAIGIALSYAGGHGLTVSFDSPLFKLAYIAYVTVAEELTFRGAMLGRSAGIVSPVAGALASSVLYGSLYLGYSWPVIAITIFAGLLASKLYFLTRRLWPSMLFTFVWKLTSVLLVARVVTF